MRIAIFASGSGTNAEAIIQAVKAGELQAEIALIVSDKLNAKVLDRAKRHQIEAIAVDPKAFETKAAYEQHILEQLKEYKVEFIALAGYMRLIGETLLHAYPHKIVNIHPSLLPSFPGLDGIEQAYKAKVKVTGVTIHYVDAGMDTGPIIAQEAVRILETDTLDLLEEKIHAVEHHLYPRTLQQIIEEMNKGENER